jgi:hypothetical protein
VKRIKLEFALGVETEFVDRDRALAQLVEWAERDTRFPVVIFWPGGLWEDCLSPAGGFWAEGAGLRRLLPTSAG